MCGVKTFRAKLKSISFVATATLYFSSTYQFASSKLIQALPPLLFAQSSLESLRVVILASLLYSLYTANLALHSKTSIYSYSDSILSIQSLCSRSLVSQTPYSIIFTLDHKVLSSLRLRYKYDIFSLYLNKRLYFKRFQPVAGFNEQRKSFYSSVVQLRIELKAQTSRAST